MKYLFGSILVFALSSYGTISQTEIHELILKGAKGAAECNKTFEKIRALDKNFDYGRTFPNKKAALKAIKLLNQFPGTPRATKELMDRLVTSRSKGIDMKWLAKEMDQTLVCDPMALNLTLTKLVRSSRTFRFNKKELQYLAKTVLIQLEKEANFPTHLGLLAPYVLILDALTDQRAIKLSEAAAQKRLELRAELDRGLAKLKDNEEALKQRVNDKEFQTRNFITEVRNNEPFRVKFLEFIDSL